MCVNAMGKVAVKSEVIFSIPRQGHRAGVRILVQSSVNWILLSVTVGREGGEYN